MGKSLRKCNLPKMTWVETESLNWKISANENSPHTHTPKKKTQKKTTEEN